MKKIRICEVCKVEYETKVIESRFCSRKCMYVWRKANNWEAINCIGCGTEFKRRKNEKHHRTGLPKQYCSNACSLSSPQKKEKLATWAASTKNHWNNPVVQAKVKETKKKLYGNENYNNSKKDPYPEFSVFKHRIKSKGKKYGSNLTTSDLKNVWDRQSGICVYSKIPLVLPDLKAPNDKLRTASLDRIDSSRGYERDNIQFISIVLNLAKNNMTHEQMLEFCKLMKLAPIT